jgi:hypothetical protein
LRILSNWTAVPGENEQTLAEKEDSQTSTVAPAAESELGLSPRLVLHRKSGCRSPLLFGALLRDSERVEDLFWTLAPTVTLTDCRVLSEYFQIVIAKATIKVFEITNVLSVRKLASLRDLIDYME